MRVSLLVLVIVVSGCGSGDDESLVERACHVGDGRVYKPGDNFPSGDGCNGCYCFPVDQQPSVGAWGCSLRACSPETTVRQACEPNADEGCTLGPPCGEGCCGQGERCVEGACVCGDGPACADGDLCGSPDVIGGDGCGARCCAPGTACE